MKQKQTSDRARQQDMEILTKEEIEILMEPIPTREELEQRPPRTIPQYIAWTIKDYLRAFKKDLKFFMSQVMTEPLDVEDMTERALKLPKWLRFILYKESAGYYVRRFGIFERIRSADLTLHIRCLRRRRKQKRAETKA